MVSSAGNFRLGPLLPRRENVLLRKIAQIIMRLARWRFEGELPNLAKAVVIVGPHTSNWDFLVGVMAMFAMNLKISWFGKHTLFRKPFGSLMRWLGGIPVNRSESQGMVGEILDAFHSRKQLLLGLSPEGTRRAVSSWRSGFWRIAKAAEVPIVPVFFDYARRVIGFEETYYPTEDFEQDLARFQKIFADATPRRIVSPESSRA